MKYTLITGASQGMGWHMAKECAALNRNILLISLPNENLSQLANDITNEFKVSCHFFEIDLTLKDSSKKIYEWVKENSYLVDFLINNAGFGGVGSFDNYSLEYIENMIDLNVKATTKMTHYFIPELKKMLLHIY